MLVAIVLVLSGTIAAQQPNNVHRLFPPSDLGLLDAPDRDLWQRPDLIMDAMGIADGSVVADIGAGSGWFTIRLARRVGPQGLVYAEDVQQ
jgi:predicted methyltransferase